MKQLTEPQAWREIGNDILNGGEMPRGLCQRIGLLAARCPYPVWNAMSERAGHHVWANRVSSGSIVYLAPPGEEREARAMFAYLMAIEAEDEAS